MNINILLFEPYPYGMACTNRIHNYALGFIKNGHNVKIIVPRATRKKGNKVWNDKLEGTHEGVEFCYTSGIIHRTNSKIKNKISDIRGPLISCISLLKERKNSDAIILVSNSLLLIIIYRIISILTNSVYIMERSEIPFKGKKDNFYTRFYIKNAFRFFDGVIVISKFLSVFLKPLIKKNARIIVIPILVNPDEFPTVNKKEPGKEITIVYTGTLDEHKDGVLTMVNAFKIVNKEFENIRMYIIGHPQSESDKQKLEDLISKYNLNSKIVITGYITREQLKSYLNNADILLLAKPDTRQAEGCMPTKLGEYLMTANPVVVTRVGVIPDFLEDEKSAYLSETDAESFAQKMLSVIKDPDKAHSIGAAGRDVALKEFDLKINTEKIIRFIDKIRQNKIKK